MNLKVIKLGLAFLLFGCLLSMPYGYFQLVRFLVSGGLVYLSMIEEDRKNLKIIYILIALLFQPFFKIALGRELWNVVDVVLGGWLLIDAFRDKENKV